MHVTSKNESCKLGIDLGGTKTEVVVLDSQCKPLHRQRIATASQNYDAILDSIARLVFEADDIFQVKLPVGIGTPGAISPQSGLLRNSNTVCLNGRAFQQDIERRLQRQVKIENDANCFTLSEAIHGAALNADVVFGVIIGTGVGAGLVVNRQLIGGLHRIAGEWGHNPMPWYQTFEGELDCYCGKSNCIETFLSGSGLAARFFRSQGRKLSGEAIVESAQQGDRDCINALEIYYDQLARALALVINIIDPDAIVLGGGMSNIDEIYRQLPQRLSPYVFSDYVATPILPARHGDASGVFGAALL